MSFVDMKIAKNSTLESSDTGTPKEAARKGEMYSELCFRNLYSRLMLNIIPFFYFLALLLVTFLFSVSFMASLFVICIPI